MLRVNVLSILQPILNRCVRRTEHKNLIPHIFNSLILQKFNSTNLSNQSNINDATDISTSEDEIDKLYKKIQVEVRGNDRAVLQSYGQFAVMVAKFLDITVDGNVAPRKAIHERLTVLKAVHVHKNHRVQYETRTYYRFLDFSNLTGSTADTFLEYIQRNLPEGVAMKVTKVELGKLPETVQQAAALQ